MGINRRFKDSVFTALFSDSETLRELYNALGGVSLPENVPVLINTLENVLYMDLYNDISFEIGGKLIVLIEHQSSINPNMALRLLLYISRVYEKTIKGNSIYSERQVKIPWPEFYVLYNGIRPYPDKNVLKLSELFEKPSDLGVSGKLHPLLELEVKVINITEGRNQEIVSRCKRLSEYSAFIARAYEYRQKEGDLDAGIKAAIKYCQKHGILEQFLETHGSEVLNMLLTEWNTEDAKKVWYEDGLHEGMEQGRKEIARRMKEKGYSPEEIESILG